MIDSFGRKITYLRLSVTDRCNLRCRYCMPAEGVFIKSHDEIMSEDEMISACKAASELGIRKIRITGGEPLVKKNIISICERISEIDGVDETALTTNGVMLSGLAKDLKLAGVKRLNISLDTLDEKKYEDITRGGNLSDVLRGIDTALDAGFEKIKINAVLIGGFNDDEIERLAGLTADKPVDLRFIELMPMTIGGFSKEAFVKNDIVLSKLSGLVDEGFDGVARMYRADGAMGRIGLISPVSCSFCADCNRIRLTADGKLKPCLHSSSEISIKGLGYDEMKAMFIRAINDKPERHGLLSAEMLSEAKRNMNQIGG